MRASTILGPGCVIVACACGASEPGREAAAGAGGGGASSGPSGAGAAGGEAGMGGTGAAGGGGAYQTLFDGTLTEAWRMSTIVNQPGQDDPGAFVVVDGSLESRPGTDLGLLWYTVPAPPDFVLELEWARTAEDDNSGVFVRFPDPESKGYDNSAWVAIDFGFEVQINEPGAPDGSPLHKTGAIYDQPGQQLTLVRPKPVGVFSKLEIHVEAQTYSVSIDGAPVSVFVNQDPLRGLPSAAAAPSFVGLQTHTGRVRFRNIRWRAL